MAWGSFHGIYLTELTEDGLEVDDIHNLTRIAGTAYEGTYIHKRGDYYYLFASTGSCCEGLKSTYQTVVGRSKSLYGPYVNKAGERMLGADPKSGRPVFVKIGRFGPVIQIGTAEDKEKPQFAQLPKEQSMESITLDEALELFKLPREVGEFEGKPVTIGAGRFGPYILHDRKYTSLPKGSDPLSITLDEAIELIREKRQQDTQKHLKLFLEDTKLEVLNGRYGPYLCYEGKNYRLPKAMHERAKELTYDECMKIIQAQPAKKS
jgi:DNA topoisomerase-1